MAVRRGISTGLSRPALPSGKAVKKLEAATAAHADKKFNAVVILLTSDDKMEGRLKELAEREKLKNVVLAVESPERPSPYHIAKDADVTVLLYEKKKVKKNFAFG